MARNSESRVFPPLPQGGETLTEYAVQWAYEVDPTVPEADLVEVADDRRVADALVRLHRPMVRLVERPVVRGAWREARPGWGPQSPMTPVDRELMLRLVAFVDTEHDFAHSSCHPEPGTDCETWCRACALLRGVEDDVLMEARVQFVKGGGRWIDTGTLPGERAGAR